LDYFGGLDEFSYQNSNFASENERSKRRSPGKFNLR
jgi:hypothetical protein